MPNTENTVMPTLGFLIIVILLSEIIELGLKPFNHISDLTHQCMFSILFGMKQKISILTLYFAVVCLVLVAVSETRTIIPSARLLYKDDRVFNNIMAFDQCIEPAVSTWLETFVAFRVAISILSVVECIR